MPTKIFDEFTYLPVSREMKKQLRRKRDGICFRCNNPICKEASEVLCKECIISQREKRRIARGYIRRYPVARSYSI